MRVPQTLVSMELVRQTVTHLRVLCANVRPAGWETNVIKVRQKIVVNS